MSDPFHEECRCGYCGCLIGYGILLQGIKNFPYSDFCDDCIENHCEEITGKSYEDFLEEQEDETSKN